MSAEKWCRVLDFPAYEVSTLGRVWSHRTDKVLAGSAHSLRGGYLRVNLRADGGSRKTFWIHRLVLEAFVGPRPDGFVTRHLNGDATDNRLANLQYGTPRENNMDTLAHGRHRRAAQTECIHGHTLEGRNVWVEPSTGHRKCLECHRQMGRAYYDRLRAMPMEELPHGKLRAYAAGCRCEPCRGARRTAYQREVERKFIASRGAA